MTLGNLLRDQLIPFGIALAEQVQPIGQQIQDSVKSVENYLHTPIISTSNQTLDSNIQNIALPALSTQQNNTQSTTQLISAPSTQTSTVEDSAKPQTKISEQPSEVADNGTFFDQISAASSSVLALKDSLFSTLSPSSNTDSDKKIADPVEDDDMPDLVECDVSSESSKSSPIANPIVSESLTASVNNTSLNQLNIASSKADGSVVSTKDLSPYSQTATLPPTTTVSDKEIINLVKDNDDSALKLGATVVQEASSSSTSSVAATLTSVLESSPVTAIVSSVIDQTTSDTGNILNQLSAASSTIVTSANSLKESILSSLAPSSAADETTTAQKTTPVVVDSAKSTSEASIPLNNSGSSKPKNIISPREIIYVEDEDVSGLELLPSFFQESPKTPPVTVSAPQKTALPKKDNISPSHSINNQNNVLNNRTKPPHTTMHSVSGRPPAKDIKIPDSVIKMFMRTKK